MRRRPRAESRVRIAAIILALMLSSTLCCCRPGAPRARAHRDEAATARQSMPMATAVPPRSAPSPACSGRLHRLIDVLSVRWTGEYVAYWAVLAVFALLLRGHRPLRLQLADQLGAREHVPDVRHAVHAGRRLRLSRGPARARRRRLLEILARAARRSADIVTSVFFFIFIGTMLWTGWRFAMRRDVASASTRSPNGASSTGR